MTLPTAPRRTCTRWWKHSTFCPPTDDSTLPPMRSKLKFWLVLMLLLLLAVWGWWQAGKGSKVEPAGAVAGAGAERAARKVGALTGSRTGAVHSRAITAERLAA